MHPNNFNNEFVNINKEFSIYKDDTSRWLAKDNYMSNIDSYVKEYQLNALETYNEYQKLYSISNTYCNNYTISKDNSKFEYNYIDENVKIDIFQKMNSIIVKQRLLKCNIIEYVNLMSSL